ncbi:MAG: primosomal protein [Anaerolineales bacterium]|nr:primosomal protein [Anaerolineales bacterium]
MIPAGLAQHADQLYSLVDPAVQPPPGTAARLVGLLRSRGPLRGRQIERHFGHPAGDRAPHPAGDWRRAVQGLMRRGVVTSAPVLDAPAVAVHRVRSARLAQSAEQVTAAFEDLGRGDAAIRRRRVLEALLQEGRPLDLTWLYAEAGARPGDLSRLRDRGLIALDAHEQTRDPLAGSSAALSLPPDLTPEQLSAWESIAQSLHSAGGAFLLHGVTGSGKTEIYLRAVARVLQDGASAIVLVPEIALTPQTTDRFLSRFPGRVGVIHSALSAGERFDTWRRARSGELAPDRRRRGTRRVLQGTRNRGALPCALGGAGLRRITERRLPPRQRHPRHRHLPPGRLRRDPLARAAAPPDEPPAGRGPAAGRAGPADRAASGACRRYAAGAQGRQHGPLQPAPDGRPGGDARSRRAGDPLSEPARFGNLRLLPRLRLGRPLSPLRDAAGPPPDGGRAPVPSVRHPAQAADGVPAVPGPARALFRRLDAAHRSGGGGSFSRRALPALGLGRPPAARAPTR